MAKPAGTALVPRLWISLARPVGAGCTDRKERSREDRTDHGAGERADDKSTKAPRARLLFCCAARIQYNPGGMRCRRPSASRTAGDPAVARPRDPSNTTGTRPVTPARQPARERPSTGPRRPRSASLPRRGPEIALVSSIAPVPSAAPGAEYAGDANRRTATENIAAGYFDSSKAATAPRAPGRARSSRWPCSAPEPCDPVSAPPGSLTAFTFGVEGLVTPGASRTAPPGARSPC